MSAPARAPADATARERLTGSQAMCLLATVLVCRLLAIRACPIYDDAFITYRYARNLAQGAGLIFNPGEPWEPVLGTTTPAYAVLLAGLAHLHIDLIAASLCVNVLCDLLSAWLILKLCEFRRVAGVVAVIAFAALPQIARISVGGMEAPLFALLALAATYNLARERPMRAGVCAALACTVRPEGVLLVAVVCCARLPRPRVLFKLLVPVLLIGAATLALLIASYGSPVPQSVSAKSQMHGPDTAWGIVLQCKSILAQSFAPHPAYLVCLPWIAIGLRAALARAGALRMFTCFALGVTLSYLAARPHIWGWYFYVPLVAWTLWLGVGVERSLPWLFARIGALERLHARLFRPAVLAALTVVAVAAASALEPTRVNQRVYRPMQQWASETSRLHPKARILASDIGAIGYDWRGTVLDSEGLTWPGALYYRFPNAIISARSPEYLLIVAEQPRLAHFMDRPDLMQQYLPIGRFSVAGETNLTPRLEELPPIWTQDYLVYKRKDL